jgi:class 3 adenylate cyclase
VVGDVKDDRRFAGRESVILYGVDRVLCIPLGTEPPFAGVLYVNTSAQTETALEVTLDVCTAMAHLVATGVQKFSSAPARPRPEAGTRPAPHAGALPHARGRRAPRRRGPARGGQAARAGGAQLTILHAELVGFGALGARLGGQRPPNCSTSSTRLSGLIFSYEGTLEAFLGDSLRALFGAPYPKGDDAIRAVRAALALRTEWERAMAPAPFEERCELRIGINTTKALVGMVGPDARPTYSAVGEGVSVATWLASSAMPGQVLITSKTLAVTGARFDVMPLGERLIRPPRDKVAAFEVVDEDVPQLTHPGVR